MKLQLLLDPELRQKTLHSSLSSVHHLHPQIPRICVVFLQTRSSHLVLGFPTGLVLNVRPIITVYSDIHAKCINKLALKIQFFLILNLEVKVKVKVNVNVKVKLSLSMT
jgi:hypothetical protein